MLGTPQNLRKPLLQGLEAPGGPGAWRPWRPLQAQAPGGPGPKALQSSGSFWSPKPAPKAVPKTFWGPADPLEAPKRKPP